MCKIFKGKALVNDSEFTVEDIWIFQCKIEVYISEWTPNAVFVRVAVATSENTSFGVHEGNKIRSYTEKNKFSVSFIDSNKA